MTIVFILDIHIAPLQETYSETSTVGS